MNAAAVFAEAPSSSASSEVPQGAVIAFLMLHISTENQFNIQYVACFYERFIFCTFFVVWLLIIVILDLGPAEMIYCCYNRYCWYHWHITILSEVQRLPCIYDLCLYRAGWQVVFVTSKEQSSDDGINLYKVVVSWASWPNIFHLRQFGCQITNWKDVE